MNVCNHHVALNLKITVPTSKVHTNVLHVMTDICCTNIQSKKEDVSVCMHKNDVIKITQLMFAWRVL